MTFQKLLVPLDFSDCAVNALKVAIDLCQRSNAKLTIFNSYNEPFVPGGIDPGFYAENLILESKEDIEKEFEALNHLLPELDEVDCDFVLSPMGVAETVNHYVNDKHHELVVMGTRGASGLKGMLFGTNTYHVAKNVQCPLLTIPEQSADGLRMDKVVLATDLHEEENLAVYKPLKDLVDLNEAELHFLHIAEKPVMSDSRTDAAWQLENYFKASEHTFHFRFEEALEDGLIDYLKAKDIKLLTVVKRKRPLLDGLFHKSLTKKLSFHTQTPLLVLHDS